jgi:beta-N-acetylhexosaminidase
MPFSLLSQKEWMGLIAPRFLVGLPGTEVNEEVEQAVRNFPVSGFVLFSRNIQDPPQLKAFCQALQTLAGKNHLAPFILAVDQEGGKVARLKPPFTQFEGHPAIGKARDPEREARRYAEITAKEFRDTGLNLNLAPVLDLHRPEEGSIMADRSFGADPHLAAQLGGVVIETLQARKVMACAKHFPGIGGTTLDSHLELPLSPKDLVALETLELIPFRQAVKSRVSAIMMTHVCYPELDPALPASLSRIMAHHLLREHLGFGGLILTDDLEMGAIEKHYQIEEAASRAFQAGVDLLLICQSLDKLKRAISHLTAEARVGRFRDEDLRASLERIHQAKREYING